VTCFPDQGSHRLRHTRRDDRAEMSPCEYPRDVASAETAPPSTADFDDGATNSTSSVLIRSAQLDPRTGGRKTAG
jgi:hypothetical protein